MTERQRKTQALISISNQIGSNKAYIQGGGGNTSVKLDENLIRIPQYSGISQSTSRPKHCHGHVRTSRF